MEADVLMGVGGLAMDVFTGGTDGNILRSGVKVGKELVEMEVKELVEQEVKELAEEFVEREVKEAAGEMAEKTLLRDAAKACGCFLAGTLILTDSGYKKIEDIRVGDIVWAYNDTTHSYGKKQVVRLFNYVRDTVYQVHIGSETIHTTSDHPFFVAGHWLRVADMRVGDSVATYKGTKVAITGIKVVAKPTLVYNFEVADYHTYYVSGKAVLVHNSGPCDVEFGALKDHAKRHGEGLDANAYKQRAVKHTQENNGVKFRHDGRTKMAYVSKLKNGNYRFTSGNKSGKRIYTHMDVSKKYLSNIGITPKQ